VPFTFCVCLASRSVCSLRPLSLCMRFLLWERSHYMIWIFSTNRKYKISYTIR
ncbi:hypothetical protein L9F63_016022, partial [Diploptera punctata]